MEGFGVFDSLPRDLRIFMLERLGAKVLPRLRLCSKTLDEFICSQIFPHIDRQMNRICEQQGKDWYLVSGYTICKIIFKIF